MKTGDLVLISLFAALTSIGAYFSIPFGPVPITLQSLMTLLSGVMLGARNGALSQVVYILLGIAGLPVFAGGAAGAGYLFGPTGGFLAGFVACSFVVGLISEPLENYEAPRITIALCAGVSVLYFFGLGGFMLVTRSNLPAAISVGLLPFLPGDLLKVIVSLLIARTAWHVRRKYRRERRVS